MVAILLGISDEVIIRRVGYVVNQVFRVMNVGYRYIESLEQVEGGEIVIFYGSPSDLALHSGCQRNIICIPNYHYLPAIGGDRDNSLPNTSGSIVHAGRTMPIYHNWIEVNRQRSIANYTSGGIAVGEEEGCVYFGFDIIMSTFHLLSCQEEYLINRRDALGRFIASYSPRFKLGYLDDPIVNYYIALLEACLNITTGVCKKDNGSRTFSVCLSHDVDNLWSRGKYVLALNLYQIAQSALGLRGRALARDCYVLSRKFLTHDTSYWNFDKYIEIESKYGAHSTFYFMCGRGGRFGARYKLESLEHTFNKLKDRGWGIGMHTNFYSYQSSDAIRKEKDILESVAHIEVTGARNHYLRFQCPSSWSNLENTGLKHDSSLGYSDATGFRAGIASPFNPYDLNNDRVFRIIEIPLVVMDTVLFRYLHLSKDDILVKLDSLTNKLASVNGCLTLLWHSSSLDELDHPGWDYVYEQALELVVAKGGKFVTVEDLIAMRSHQSDRVSQSAISFDTR